VKLTDSIKAVKARFEETKHSKLIVVGDSIDDIVGYVHLNDVVRAIAGHKEVALSDLVRRIDFFPETYTADRLLKHFIQKRQGIAAVVDEFGGTSGIVTMEDVLEEIVGDIWDDNDEIEEEVIESETGELIVDGDMPIGDFLERLGIDEDDWEYESQTAGGWAIEFMEDFPKEGDAFDYEDFHIVVSEAEERRVVQLTITRTADKGDET